MQQNYSCARQQQKLEWGENNLMLALEPEVASLCVQRDYDGDLPVGSKYIIVDCGGGTVDFACHELVDGGCRETHHAIGGPWGSTYLDAGFVQLLKNVFSSEAISKIERTHPLLWMDLMDEWEKRTLDGQ
eukprot:TRINITY_DN385_c0_g3_i3.p1 TRINITY_DN385_c0_g3~~TRINITY_DN385_c0_g3_i3.p1  ORF type:complete len:130 (-),score=29.95 TRINITY_DN385_c0_g3_i3:62-451(-)